MELDGKPITETGRCWHEERWRTLRRFEQEPWPGTWSVPAGQYFILGDFRDNSMDSRARGLVSSADIVGRVGQIWLSLEPGTFRLRPERIGICP